MKDDGQVHQFLGKHLLHWIEALSWLGKASNVIFNLKSLKSVVDVSYSLALLVSFSTDLGDIDQLGKATY